MNFNEATKDTKQGKIIQRLWQEKQAFVVEDELGLDTLIMQVEDMVFKVKRFHNLVEVLDQQAFSRFVKLLPNQSKILDPSATNLEKHTLTVLLNTNYFSRLVILKRLKVIFNKSGIPTVS